MPKILPFDQALRRNPLNHSRNDAKVMLMICVDLMSDDPSSGVSVEKDIDLYNELQEYLADLELQNTVTREELEAIICDMVEQYKLMADLDSVTTMLQEDILALGPDSKLMLLEAYGQKRDEAPVIPELHL